VRHLDISAANFSISTLVLAKQQRFKHKRRYSQVHKHKNWIMITQILSYGTYFNIVERNLSYL